MKDKKIIWKKGESVITQIVPECECGGVAKLIGTAGFYDEYTYIYQCPKCKTIAMFDRAYGHNSEEDFIGAGWKEPHEK